MAYMQILRRQIDWANDAAARKKLADLWAQTKPQLSASEIGQHFGITKAAILRAVARLDLPNRPTPIGRRANNGHAVLWENGQKTAPAKSQPRVKKPLVIPLPSMASEPANDAGAPKRRDVPEKLDHFGCCWPIGTPGAAGFRYCEEPLLRPGRPYCLEHTAAAAPNPAILPRERVTVAEVEAYAAEHRVIPKMASGLLGLIVAVNNHRRARGEPAFTVAQQA